MVAFSQTKLRPAGGEKLKTMKLSVPINRQQQLQQRQHIQQQLERQQQRLEQQQQQQQRLEQQQLEQQRQELQRQQTEQFQLHQQQQQQLEQTQQNFLKQLRLQSLRQKAINTLAKDSAKENIHSLKAKNRNKSIRPLSGKRPIFRLKLRVSKYFDCTKILTKTKQSHLAS